MKDVAVTTTHTCSRGAAVQCQGPSLTFTNSWLKFKFLEMGKPNLFPFSSSAGSKLASTPTQILLSNKHRHTCGNTWQIPLLNFSTVQNAHKINRYFKVVGVPVFVWYGLRRITATLNITLEEDEKFSVLAWMSGMCNAVTSPLWP